MKTGFGWYRERRAESDQEVYTIGATLDVSRGLSSTLDPPHYPIFFPGHGTTMPYSRYFGADYPDPLSSCPDRAFQGAPIVVQFGSLPEVSSATLVKDGLRLDRCAFDESTYVNDDAEAQANGREVLAGRHAVAIMPREPLTAGIYRVTLVNGGLTYSWAFAGPDTARVPTFVSPDAAVLPVSAAPSLSSSPFFGHPDTPIVAPRPRAAPASPVRCSTRDDTGVGVVRQGADRLLTVVAARGSNNMLRQLHFGQPAQPLENASIVLNGYPAPITQIGTVTLPPDTRQVSFAVERVAGGRAMRAPFTITDSRGDFSTFVEAGPTLP